MRLPCIAKRVRAPEGGYIPNPYGRDLGLGIG